MKPAKKAELLSAKELARYIDYSVLKPEFTRDEIISLTKDAVKLGCESVCINPAYLDVCEPYVKNTETALCPVCDFPFGASSTESKIKQIEIASRNAAVKEIDVVSPFGLIRSETYDEVERDIRACTEAAHRNGKQIKIIFETDVLGEAQIRKLCRICVDCGADFVKTSTGFVTGYELKGATPEIIALMLEETAGKCKVKGSGCIRTREHFLTLIDMGIDRMGVGYKSVPVVLNLSGN